MSITAPHLLVLLSIFISLFGVWAYVRDTLKGKTRPNRVSWLMWSVAPFIGAAAAISSGSDFWATLRIFTAGLMPAIIFSCSFLNPASYWKLSLFDLLCGILSLFALIFWLLIDAPRMAILFAALGDGFASLPTIVKAWKYPETETGVTYFTSFLSALLVIPSIPIWNIENSAFHLYPAHLNFSECAGQAPCWRS